MTISVMLSDYNPLMACRKGTKCPSLQMTAKLKINQYMHKFLTVAVSLLNC